MAEIKKATFLLSFGVPIFLLLFLFLIFLGNDSTVNDSTVVVANNGFSIPFEDEKSFVVTSPFGYRYDPFSRGKALHTGIDLGAKEGTNVLASADGVVERVGFENGGLGNYVFIKHKIGDEILYTGYGHMLDDSIIVEVGQIITQGQKIGEVGTTGASTGFHLHFMIMKGKISYKYEDLVDPDFVINGLE